MLHPYERQRLLWAHRQLINNNLVAWTSGNVSMRLPSTNMVLIKPSGILYEDLDENSFVVVGMDGQKVEGDLKPSTDALAHLHIYKCRPEINAIVHTHSPYVCAWAAVGNGPLVCLTEMADIFGDTLFVDPYYAPIGDTSMGVNFCKFDPKVHTLILRNHGLLATGPDLKTAVQRAVMAEHVCKSVAIATMLPAPLHIKELSPAQVADNYTRYNKSYGQGKV